MRAKSWMKSWRRACATPMPARLTGWKMVVFFTGFTTNAAIVGFYSLVAAL